MHTVSPLRLISVALLVALCGCSTTGHSPMISLPRTVKDPATRPGVIQGHLRAPGRATAASMSEYIIYVDPLKIPPPPVARRKSKPAKRAAAAVPPRPARVQLGLEPGGFAPRVVAVAPGDSVDFVNRDRRYHSAFSVSAARRWWATGGLTLCLHQMTVAFQFCRQKLSSLTGACIAAIGCGV